MLKEISSKILKKASEKVIDKATASFCTIGFEKMPESIKKTR